MSFDGISLRSFGYKMSNDDSSRHAALSDAVYFHGYEAVMNRLQYVRGFNPTYSQQIECDILYIVYTYMDRKVSMQNAFRAQIMNLIDTISYCLHHGASLNDIGMINYHNNIMQDLVSILNKIN
jgi:hypothetical protein